MSTSSADSCESGGGAERPEVACAPPLLGELSLEFYVHLTYPPGHEARRSRMPAAMTDEEEQVSDDTGSSTPNGEGGTAISRVEWEAMRAKEYAMRPRCRRVNYNVTKVLEEMSKQKAGGAPKRKRSVPAEPPPKPPPKKARRVEAADEELVLHRPVEIRHLLLQGVLPGKRRGHVAGRHVCAPSRGAEHPILALAYDLLSRKTK